MKIKVNYKWYKNSINKIKKMYKIKTEEGKITNV